MLIAYFDLRFTKVLLQRKVKYECNFCFYLTFIYEQFKLNQYKKRWKKILLFLI
jgi:hypothetical protein